MILVLRSFVTFDRNIRKENLLFDYRLFKYGSNTKGITGGKCEVTRGTEGHCHPKHVWRGCQAKVQKVDFLLLPIVIRSLIFYLV